MSVYLGMCLIQDDRMQVLFLTRRYRLIILDSNSVNDAKPSAERVATDITKICPCPQKAHKVVGQTDR